MEIIRMTTFLQLFIMIIGRSYVFAENCVQRGDMLDCKAKNLTEIPYFKNNGITAVDLSENKLLEIPNFAFAHLKNLTDLLLYKNQINILHSKAFSGLKRLQTLNLENNNITFLPDDIFIDTFMLKKLLINGNKWRNGYPLTALSFLSQLEVLTIGFLNSYVFDDRMYNLGKLAEISFDFLIFGIQIIHNNTFYGLAKSPIKTFIFHGPIIRIELNSFQYFNNLENFHINVRGACKLKHVLHSLYGFQFKTVDKIWIEQAFTNYGYEDLSEEDAIYLKTINTSSLTFKQCFINNIFPKFFPQLSQLNIKYIDFSYNFINPVDLVFSEVLTELRVAIISGYRGKLRKHINSNTMADMIFSLPPKLQYLDMSFSQWSFPRYTLTFKAPALTFLDISNSRNLICKREFTIKGLTKLEILNISNIKCENPANDFFDFPSLKILIARNIKLNETEIMTNLTSLFGRLNKLEMIDLSKNILSLKEPFLNVASKSIKHIALSAMNLTSFPFNLVQNLSVLKWIDLENNYITSIDQPVIMFLHQNKKLKIKLGGNRLSCTCRKNELTFLKSLHLIKQNIYFFEMILCTTENGTITHLSKIINELQAYEMYCMSKLILNISIIFSVIFVLIIIIIVFVYKYRYFIEYIFLRMHKNRKMFPKNTVFRYDLFLCFSSKDSSWVRKELFNRLVETLDLNICVYDRDFPLASPIADCIIEAIDDSKRILFVVTKEFLKSEWCEYETEMAKTHLIKTGAKSLSVIILMKDDIPISAMPKQLKWMWKRYVGLKWYESQKEKSFKKLCKALKKNTGNTFVLE